MYEIKLVGIDKTSWVQERDVDVDAVQSFKNGSKIAENSKARVNRALFDQQKKFLLLQPMKNQVTDPIKLQKRSCRWVITGNNYVAELNKVLRVEKKRLVEAVHEFVSRMQPPKRVLPNLQTTYFQTGRLVRWEGNTQVLSPTPEKPG